MGRISSLVFLMTLAVSVIALPQALQKFMSSASKPDTAAVQKESAFIIDQDPLAAYSESMSEQQMENLFGKERPKVEVRINPLVGRLLEKKSSKKNLNEERRPKKVGLLIRSLGPWVSLNKDKIKKASMFIATFFILLGFIMGLLGLKSLSRSSFSFCHFVGGTWLFLLSIFAVGIFVTLKMNLWIELPIEIWAWPIVMVLSSVGFLRILDMNYPVWNGTVRCFFVPLCAYLVAFIWDKIV